MRRGGSSHISRRSARASLALLLSGCTKERLAEFTPERLTTQFNVTLKTAEEMLSEARAKRPAA